MTCIFYIIVRPTPCLNVFHSLSNHNLHRPLILSALPASSHFPFHSFIFPSSLELKTIRAPPDISLTINEVLEWGWKCQCLAFKLHGIYQTSHRKGVTSPVWKECFKDKQKIISGQLLKQFLTVINLFKHKKLSFKFYRSTFLFFSFFSNREIDKRNLLRGDVPTEESLGWKPEACRTVGEYRQNLSLLSFIHPFTYSPPASLHSHRKRSIILSEVSLSPVASPHLLLSPSLKAQQRKI